MHDNQYQRFALSDASYLSAVKRDITRLAQSAGFSETETGRINIVVSELASNLVRHATEGGELLVRVLEEESGIEIISLDRGPGMVEPQRMAEDGVSTYGSAGEGLGAIKRQSEDFHLYSQPDSGTAILSRIYKTVGNKPQKPVTGKLEVGAIRVAKRLGEPSGDNWALKKLDKSIYLLVLDGLGHGAKAHEASLQAISCFHKSKASSLPDQFREIHEAIKPTRGAVGGLARIGATNEDFRYCGIGNISAKVLQLNGSAPLSVTKNLMSYNGTLGHALPKQLQEQTSNWATGNILLMYSDGLRSSVNLTGYPKIQQLPASLIAAILFRDFNRGSDDALVLIAKAKS